MRCLAELADQSLVDPRGERSNPRTRVSDLIATGQPEIQIRQSNHAAGVSAVVPQRDRGTPFRQARGEILRAVDGVHYGCPAGEGLIVFTGSFFSDEPQTLQLRSEIVLKALLHQQIRFCHRSVITFDGDISAEFVQLRYQALYEVTRPAENRAYVVQRVCLRQFCARLSLT